MVPRGGQNRFGLARARGHGKHRGYPLDRVHRQSQSGSRRQQPSLRVEAIAQHLGGRALGDKLLDARVRHQSVHGHIVGAGNAVQKHVRLLNRFQRLANLVHLAQLAQRVRRKRIRQVQRPVMPAQLSGNRLGQGARLRLRGLPQTAARRKHGDVHRRAARNVLRHLLNRRAAVDGENHAVGKQLSKPCARHAPDLAQHVRRLIRVARHDAHVLHLQQPGELHLHRRQPQLRAHDFPNAVQHAVGLVGQNHARRGNLDPAARTKRVGQHPGFPLRHSHALRQRPTADRLKH